MEFGVIVVVLSSVRCRSSDAAIRLPVRAIPVLQANGVSWLAAAVQGPGSAIEPHCRSNRVGVSYSLNGKAISEDSGGPGKRGSCDLRLSAMSAQLVPGVGNTRLHLSRICQSRICKGGLPSVVRSFRHATAFREDNLVAFAAAVMASVWPRGYEARVCTTHLW